MSTPTTKDHIKKNFDICLSSYGIKADGCGGRGAIREWSWSGLFFIFK